MTTTPTVPDHLSLFPAFTASTNSALLAALKDLPGHDENAAAASKMSAGLRAARADLSGAMQARRALLGHVTDSTRAGKDIPRDLPTQAGKVADALTRAQATMALLTDVERALAAERDRVLVDAPDALLRHLDAQLQEVVTQARGLDLNDVTNADDAIAGGRTDDWTAAMRLHDKEQEIRHAQRQVMRHLLNNPDAAQHLETFGQVRNYAALFTKWFERQTRQPMSTVNGDPVQWPTPWPDSTRGFWLYAITHVEVEVWVPTLHQLQDAYAEARTEARDLANAVDREEQGASLTGEDRERLRLRQMNERRLNQPSAAALFRR